MIYEGHKILPYCPRCGTGPASHEVAQGYKEVKVTTMTAKFKRKGRTDEYFLAWTTTPWTLASNVSLTVGPDVDYIKVKMISGDERGQGLLCCKGPGMTRFWEKASYEVLEEMKGSDLEYVEYEQLMPFMQAGQESFLRNMRGLRIHQKMVPVSYTRLRHSVKTTIRRGRKLRSAGTCTRWMNRVNTPRLLGRVSFVMEDGLDVEIIKYLAEGRQDLRQGKDGA